MQLNQTQKKQYRAIAHGLNPVVTIAGNGLSENVLAELGRALSDHELIKVKLVVGDRDAKQVIITEMLKASASTLVQQIGNVAIIYRRNPQADPKKSNLSK